MTLIDLTENQVTLLILGLMLAALLLRICRIQTGTCLMVVAPVLAFIAGGLETGVSIMDAAFLQETSFKLWILFMGLQALSLQNRRLATDLVGSLADFQRSSAFVVPGLSSFLPLIFSSREAQHILDDSLVTENPSQRKAVHLWFRYFTIPILALSPLCFAGPVLAGLEPALYFKWYWPIPLIGLLSGLLLSRQIQDYRIPSHPGLSPLLRLALPCMILLSVFVWQGLDAALIGVLVLVVLFQIVNRQSLFIKKISVLQPVRWAILACALVGWPFVLGELGLGVFTEPDYSLHQVFRATTENHLHWMITASVVSLGMGFFSGSPLLALAMTLPLFTEGGREPMPVLLVTGLVALGVALSPIAHRDSLLEDRVGGTWKQHLKLVYQPALIALGCLLFILIA